MRHTKTVTACFFRMKFLHQADGILSPALAPEGRSHYAGQKALYLSGSPEGTVIASRIYMKPDDPPRGIFCLHVEGAFIIDLRDKVAAEYHGIDMRLRSIDWQGYRDRGEQSPTWDISDKLRNLGVAGMIYSSRSDPENTHHLTLFDWNTPGRPQVSVHGAPVPWPQSSAL